MGSRFDEHKTLRHPEVGEIEVHCQALFTEDQSQVLLVLTPVPGSGAAEALGAARRRGGAAVQRGARLRRRSPGVPHRRLRAVVSRRPCIRAAVRAAGQKAPIRLAVPGWPRSAAMSAGSDAAIPTDDVSRLEHGPEAEHLPSRRSATRASGRDRRDRVEAGDRLVVACAPAQQGRLGGRHALVECVARDDDAHRVGRAARLVVEDVDLEPYRRCRRRCSRP